MPNASYIFDRKRVALHKMRAKANFGQHDFLFREAAARLAERLEDIKRTFSSVLDVSGYPLGETLDAPDNNYDLILSAGGLHWVNDLPGMLVQIFRALKPDGLFLAIMPGGETLKELRISLEQAELSIKGGISPRVSPFIDVRDAGSLLQRAGFALPVVDSDVLTVEYEHPLGLLHDLRGMGEGNALVESVKTFTSRTLMMAAMEYYASHFPANDGRVAASFEFVTLTGWKPHESQQKPAKRGSGKVSLGDALG